ncbi:MAG: Fe-S-binding domain-containing protein [Actinobacteria bacterium]|nr:Fe-S-binding domain-containing protein [Actinomycetota bacterium]
MHAYVAAGGYVTRDDDDVLARLAAADLRGRGGAGFPALRKLESLRAAAAGERVVVANGEEGEPLSVKDRYLLRFRPHRVLDGLEHVARLTGASRTYVYASDADGLRAVSVALKERDPSMPVDLVACPGTYVAGEETAAVNWIDRRDARPTDKPPRPFEQGVDGLPTLVANVETLAALAALCRAPQGDSSAATFLATISTPDGARLVELPSGLPMRVLAEHCGLEPGGAVLMGGFFGGIVPLAAVAALEPAALRTLDSSLGCGALLALGRGHCPVGVAAAVAAYFARHNAQQCGVCQHGTTAVSRLLAAVRDGQADARTIAELERLAALLPGRGACALPDGVARLVRTLIAHFGELVRMHADADCEACREAGAAFGASDFRVEPPASDKARATETCA